MSRNRKMDFAAGVQDGIPICLGYIAVSFTFGIMAKNAGLSTWEAVLISLTNLTSAGQFAGLSLITASASYFEMAVTQLAIIRLFTVLSLHTVLQTRCSESPHPVPERSLLGILTV